MDYTSLTQQKSHKRMGSSRSLIYRPRNNDNLKERKPCVFCNKGTHPRDKCPLRTPRVTFARSKGISSEPVCVKKQVEDQKLTIKMDKRLHNINASSDPESGGYEDNHDLNPVIIDTVRSQNVREVFAPVVFNPSTNNSVTYTVQGKVYTGAMVSCMLVSMLPQIGLSSNDLTPYCSIIRGMSGADVSSELWNC